jgi:hypothetical protein
MLIEGVVLGVIEIEGVIETDGVTVGGIIVLKATATKAVSSTDAVYPICMPWLFEANCLKTKLDLEDNG